MKIFFLFLIFVITFINFAYSDEWKMKNKWKVSCGIVDKDALTVNGKAKKSYNKNEFKILSVYLFLIPITFAIQTPITKYNYL